MGLSRPYEKIDRAKLGAWHAEVKVWTDSELFRVRVDEILATRGVRKALFRQGGMQFLMDAWVAARIATARNAMKVRLCADERPDLN